MIKLLGVVGLFLSLLGGCAFSSFHDPLKLEDLDIHGVLSTHEDYSTLLQYAPDFDPVVLELVALSNQQYLNIRDSWLINASMKDIIYSIDNLTLTESTYLFVFQDANDLSRGALAVIDIDKKVTLLLVYTLRVEVSM